MYATKFFLKMSFHWILKLHTLEMDRGFNFYTLGEQCQAKPRQNWKDYPQANLISVSYILVKENLGFHLVMQ
jgi:hypothetical protein